MKKDLILIKLIALIGLLISAYLSFTALSGGGINYCITGTECDVVNSSVYSQILGIPVSIIGLIGYLLILVVSFLSVAKRKKWNYLFVLTTAGLSFSLYLTYLEIFKLNVICSFCVASLISILALFIIVLVKKDSMAPNSSPLNLATLAIVLSAVVIFGASTIHSSTDDLPPSNSYQTNLAKHLASAGAVMYGAYNCPHCLSQKNDFGQSFKYIKYVECNTRGQNANPSLCFAKGITVYPTWEISGKFYTGKLRLEKLSELSNFKQQNE